MDDVGNITCIYCKFPYCNTAWKRCENCGKMPLGEPKRLTPEQIKEDIKYRNGWL